MLNDKFSIIATSKCWIEDNARQQLKDTASLPGVTKAVGLPDLHFGKTPVGAVFATKGIIYPFLVGNDLGCGIGLFVTSSQAKKFNPERIAPKLFEIQSLKDIPGKDIKGTLPEEVCPIRDLGTLGGGNHFLEFQVVEKIYSKEDFKLIGFDPEKLLVMVHSGSRDYGQKIYEEFGKYLEGLPAGEDLAKQYLASHLSAQKWAKINREVAANKVLSYLGVEKATPILDLPHNFVEEYHDLFIHRKGAVSALTGIAVVAGSRGTFSYLVKPKPECFQSLYSLSHGAGRKWARGVCKGRLTNKYPKNAIFRTKLKSEVICHNKELLYEEAPEAYKNIEEIILALVQANLCEVVCSLRPLLTLKV
ncbi:MAG: RNA ligase RtcB family protein [Deltaproteobacteria bacterium]|nr:RNA ligase RtcB family protein [Deltaproteobacteria bacterium]